MCFIDLGYDNTFAQVHGESVAKAYLKPKKLRENDHYHAPKTTVKASRQPSGTWSVPSLSSLSVDFDWSPTSSNIFPDDMDEGSSEFIAGDRNRRSIVVSRSEGPFFPSVPTYLASWCYGWIHRAHVYKNETFRRWCLFLYVHYTPCKWPHTRV